MAYVTMNIKNVNQDDKEKAIAVLQEEIGLSLNGATQLYRLTLASGGCHVEVPAKNAERLTNSLKECNSEVAITSPALFEDSNPNAGFHPIASPDAVSAAGRQESMDILSEAAKIAQAFEYYARKEPQLVKRIEQGKKAAEELRTALSPEAKRKIWIGAIVFGILGTFIVPVIGTAIGALIAAFVVELIVKGPDLELHKVENDARADEYIHDNIERWQAQLDDLRADRDSPINQARRVWAVDVVSEGLFYSTCIYDLHDLIKNRRADTIKEALNKYDDEQYKARMAEMQKATQDAAEKTAAESVKQTQQLKDMAQTARTNAAINYGTYQNTKKK